MPATGAQPQPSPAGCATPTAPIPTVLAAPAASPALTGSPGEPAAAPLAARHAWRHRLPGLVPGLLLAIVVSLAAGFAAEQSGGAPLVYALVLGAALHGVADHARAQAGLAWAAGPLLRLGVGLLGIRLSVQQVSALGLAPLLLMGGAMISTLALGLLGARWLRLPWQWGLLAGGANAICGASATLALATVLPRHDPQLPRQTVVVAASATAMSTLAMLLYPLVARFTALGDVQAGIFLGGSIQDVAQVVAAGYAHSPRAGDAAIALKLARVALLGPVVALVALGVRVWQARQAAVVPVSRVVWVPPFVWLFFGLMALNTTGAVSPAVQGGLTTVSQACIIVAMAALGLRLSLRELLRAGWRPFVLLALLALWIALVMGFGAGYWVVPH